MALGMLVDLCIHSFVLIDRLDLSPATGFTALTGETGAGKSIILDALSVALGGPAERRMVRAGDAQATIRASFSLPSDHAVWSLLEAADIAADRDELLTLRRVVPVRGAIRAHINDQPVSAARLREVGEYLVDMHGQHAAMGLLRPGAARTLLDQYAGNEALLAACAEAWAALRSAVEARDAIERTAGEAAERQASLDRDIAAIDELAPEPGEADALAGERAVLAHQQRLRDGLGEAEAALGGGAGRGALAQAARAVERLCRLPGLEAGASALGARLHQLGEGLERALIELDEAESLLTGLLSGADGEDGRLEAVEARLFALRGLARRFGVEPDALAGLRDRLAAEQAEIEAGEETLAAARARETEAKARWRMAAEQLGAARRAAAKRLGSAVARELAPLIMAGLRLRMAVSALPEASAGAHGADQVVIEVEPRKGAGFGPLGKIASGGELARVSLALRCALADAGAAPVLVFDEADQGVGGAVAAAIGERLARLGGDRQVFAVTHSPQVAACADAQWRIEKGTDRKGLGQTCVSRLDDSSRLEELARMLSGRTVTQEARHAAARLLEVSCPRTSP